MNDYSNDDVEFEANDDSNEALGSNAKIKQLREQLKEAQQKRDEYLAGWQREKADAINMKREAMHDAERRAMREKTNLIEDIIPVLDSFDMATGSESWTEINDGFKTGMEAVRNQLLDVLARNGVERYGKVGEQFNPHTEEAVQEVDDAPGEPHSVVKILRFGYKTGDRVIRPAQVIVKSSS
jgi:molecular chaperone GrpE